MDRLYQLRILDTPQDQCFERLVEEALLRVPGATIAAISLVDANRQWFKAIIGLDATETPRDVSFCSHTIQSSGIMVVEDATADSRFAANPLVTSFPKICFYAGVKLLAGVGARCVIGPQARRATESELADLDKLANLVDIQLLSHGTLYNLGQQSSIPPASQR